MAKLLLLGGAGFIGSTTCERLLKENNEVTVLDNFNEYYDPALKRKNVDSCIKVAQSSGKYTLIEGDIRDSELISKLLSENNFDGIICFAANAGVRPSIENPRYYFDVNVNGLLNVLEGMRNSTCKKLVFISSSSVYGNNKSVPFKESDNVDHPISPYACSKKAGELMCYTYHDLFNLDIHCLRYFTVYGPRQRPDLAINKFTRLLLNDEEIPMFGDGSTARDYTYVDDIVEGTCLSLNYLLNNEGVYDIFNLGGSHPIKLKEMIEVIASELGKEAKIKQLPMQLGDVEITYSDYSHAREVLNYEPKVSFKEGIHNFVKWYKENME